MKKKKIIALVILIIGVLAICWVIAGDKILSLFNKIPLDQNSEEGEPILIYAQNSKNKLVGVTAYVDELSEDLIQQKFDLLTKNAALLPEGYYSPIGLSTTLIDYEIKDGALTLNVSDDFMRSNEGRITLECLVMNFVNDEDITLVNLKVEGEPLDFYNDIPINGRLKKSFGVNLTLSTLYLDEANVTTIIQEENGVIIPVTYFHDHTDDVYVFILEKTIPLEVSNVNGINYNYLLEDNTLTINFLTVSELDEVVVRNLVNSIKANFDFNQITITASTNVIYNEAYA